jgi:tripartite-type tricarboxylate transporter receptor subunit TctC
MKEVGLGNATIAPWWALLAPKKTPADILAKLEGWLSKVVASPETAAFLGKLGAEPLPGNQAKTRQMMAESLKEWARIVAIAKITPQ